MKKDLIKLGKELVVPSEDMTLPTPVKAPSTQS